MRSTDSDISLRFVKSAFNRDLESMVDFSKLSEAVWITKAPLDSSMDSGAIVVVVDAGNGSATHIDGAETATANMIAATPPLTIELGVMAVLLLVEVGKSWSTFSLSSAVGL